MNKEGNSCKSKRMNDKKTIFISGVTVMLSLTVFMNIVSELMPITSDAVPLIGKYVFIVWMLYNILGSIPVQLCNSS